MNVGRIPGFDGWGLNTFVNVNQGMPGQVPTVETTFRYQDNVHIRTGTPVSCAQIGYAASDTPVPPSPPTEVIISTITRMRGIFVTRFREIILFVSAGLIAAIHIYVKKV